MPKRAPRSVFPLLRHAPSQGVCRAGKLALCETPRPGAATNFDRSRVTGIPPLRAPEIPHERLECREHRPRVRTSPREEVRDRLGADFPMHFRRTLARPFRVRLGDEITTVAPLGS